MKNLIRLTATLSLIFSMNSYAAFECTSTINAVLIYANGQVNVNHSGRGDFTVICNLNAEHQGVGVTTCAMWTSMLLQLKKDGAKADFYYTTTPQYNSCAALPTYASAPAPAYIGPVTR